ncbi:hypothetical protein DFS34DRAFT_647974 [Phlyctochytrium arcticum]|nr:hypothetical protein DFS34DRAFT_647974 [Phlyctochytrium arcticum]
MSSVPWACGLNGVSDLDGYTLDHWTLQTHLCVSNKLVLIFSIPNVLLSASVCGLMIYFLIRDFQIVGHEWTLSKSFYVSTSITCMGLMIGGLEVFTTGRATSVLNSMVWVFGSEGLMVAAFCTLFHWIKFTIKMLDFQDQEILRVEMLKLRKMLLLPTLLVFLICIPILLVRASFDSLENQLVYNISALLYFGSMIPWFVNWAICSHKFANHFSSIIENTVKETSDCLQSNLKTTNFPVNGEKKENAVGLGSVLTTGVITTLRSEMPDDDDQKPPKVPSDVPTAFKSTATTNGGPSPAKKSATEMLKVAQRVRWVGIGIVFDKALFTVAYVSVMIVGGITWRMPEKLNAPYGFYAFYVMVLPGANFLILAMSYYHYRTKPAPKPVGHASASNANQPVARRPKRKPADSVLG